MADSSCDGGGHALPAAVFAHVVRAAPEGEAIRWSPDAVTTNAELDRLSNRLARVLLSAGVGKRDTVGIQLEKGLVAYGAMVACLKIGAAYFHLDPSNPPARTALILDRCRPAFVFREPSAFDGIEGDDGPLVLDWTVDGADPAYVMFTSGSTGTPKGATISQSNLAHFISWVRQQYGIGPGDRVSNLNPLFFDNSVFDVYAGLFTGATLVPFTASMLQDPAGVLARLDALGCTVYFSVPSLLMYFQRLKLVDSDSFRSVRQMLFGGEGYPKPMLRRLHHAIGRRVALHNVYGPTECTCICSSYRVTEDDLREPDGYAPLGRLAQGYSREVLDGEGHVTPPGDIGELYLGGPAVGLGYFNAPEQTAAAFVQNPTHQRFFDRMYRTGDLVRQDPVDHKLYFVGRRDAQVKHQGYRIELGEVEHAAAAVAGVEEVAAVYVARDGAPGMIVLAVGASVPVSVGAVKAALADRLPTYMRPARVLVMTDLPKNANGKVDRLALRAMASPQVP